MHYIGIEVSWSSLASAMGAPPYVATNCVRDLGHCIIALTCLHQLCAVQDCVHSLCDSYMQVWFQEWKV